MKIVGAKILSKFKQKHADCRKQINEWIAEIEKSEWKNFSDMKKDFPGASILSGNTVIFNIKGNNYRLVTVIVIVGGKVFIEWIGTHAEYDKKTF